MFVLIGDKDNDLNYVKEEARAVSERFRKYEEKWFANKPTDLPTLGPDDNKRLTFRGHGGLKKFGNLSPQGFYALLKRKKRDGDVPDSIEAVDFIACNIGLKHADSECWIEQVAALINQDQEFKHIKSINGILFHDTANKYKEMSIFHGKIVCLITHEGHEEFKKMQEQVKQKITEKDKLDAEMRQREILTENSQGYIEAIEKIDSQKEKIVKLIHSMLDSYEPKDKQKQEFKAKILEFLDKNKFIVIRKQLQSSDLIKDIPPDLMHKTIKLITKRRKIQKKLKANYTLPDREYIKPREERIKQINSEITQIMAPFPKLAVFLAKTDSPRELLKQFPNLVRDESNQFITTNKPFVLPDQTDFVKLCFENAENFLELEKYSKHNVTSVLLETTKSKLFENNSGLPGYQDYESKLNTRWTASKQKPTLSMTNTQKSVSTIEEVKTKVRVLEKPNEHNNSTEPYISPSRRH